MAATLGAALEASSMGMASARRSMDQAADKIADFGQASASEDGVEGSYGDLVGDILQISQEATSFKANAAVARIADQAAQEIVNLGERLDRKV